MVSKLEKMKRMQRLHFEEEKKAFLKKYMNEESLMTIFEELSKHYDDAYCERGILNDAVYQAVTEYKELEKLDYE